MRSAPDGVRFWRTELRALGRTTRDALERLVGGLGTAALALTALFWLLFVAVGCLVGVGLPFVPTALRLQRFAADRERARLSRRGGDEVVSPGPAPARWRDAVADPVVRREWRWLAIHGTYGLVLGILGIVLPVNAVRDGTFPLWWKLLPPQDATSSLGYPVVHDWIGAFGVWALGVAWIAIAVGLGPALARAQSRPGRRLLPPGADVDLSMRIAELTATRAAALDAHATELRRIERSLHDGTQNRLVGVTVLLGAARRALARDPRAAGEMLERAQDAAEQALAELRTVARSILPPVLADRGLAGALDGLAAASGVPCRVDVDLPGRCAAAVEATAYFVVAEALTNVAKHSGARAATVTVRRHGGLLSLAVTDDGHGGADEDGGSGLTGIRRRVGALDGTLTLTSPPGGPTTLRVELPCGS
ncbi:sensor histidine kinase [Pseudosporangium ferrugineum]|uniref:histidine kinase n=1 Tax=Pseudosporangium ferrugineum TaxID=439699 RepID=A0A2T0SG14_9ACTN|nr:sensor histidine kinase [Pseudosporangium ferrugineum]PRY32352.1 histidine kinase [Pseudosporangium ferrugineum]